MLTYLKLLSYTSTKFLLNYAGFNKNNLFGNYISFKTLTMLKLYEMFKHKYSKQIGAFLLSVYFKSFICLYKQL